jgi:hypothetical protein
VLTVREAAARAGFNPEHIRRLCRAKLLKVRVERGRFLIDPASLEHYLAERQGARQVNLTASEVNWLRQYGPESLRARLQ